MNIVTLKPTETDGPANISARLRELADEIDAGKWNPKTVIVVQDLADCSVDAMCIGYRPSVSKTIGLLEFAKMMFFERSA